MDSLFPKEIRLPIQDGDILYYPQFFEAEQANSYFDILKRTVPWQQDTIRVYGKTYNQPRLTALYANNGKPYSYSNITMQPHCFSEVLMEIQRKIKATTGIDFTTCLLNRYRDGNDSNGWHADDEKELGKNPVIASVTLGQERYFHFKHKKNKNLKDKILLEHGSLLLMQGETQHNWLHQIPKTSRPIGERINLTFRVIS